MAEYLHLPTTSAYYIYSRYFAMLNRFFLTLTSQNLRSTKAFILLFSSLVDFDLTLMMPKTVGSIQYNPLALLATCLQTLSLDSIVWVIRGARWECARWTSINNTCWRNKGIYNTGAERLWGRSIKFIHKEKLHDRWQSTFTFLKLFSVSDLLPESKVPPSKHKTGVKIKIRN